MNTDMKETIQLDGPYLDILSLRHEGYCCSQIIMKLVLQDLGQENPELVRSMAALCYGSGSSTGTCGLLTGAACALSLCLGNGSESELAASDLPLLLGELVGWFTSKTESAYGGVLCGEILAASPDKRACTVLLIATLEKLQAMRITAACGTKRGRDHGAP